MSIPAFMDLLQRMAEIHTKKKADYATAANPFDNFERSGEIASWFTDPTDKAFAILVGTKLARLGNLLNEDKEPQNESVDDSFLDLCTYCALWASYRKSKAIDDYSQETAPYCYDPEEFQPRDIAATRPPIAHKSPLSDEDLKALVADARRVTEKVPFREIVERASREYQKTTHTAAELTQIVEEARRAAEWSK